MAAISPIPSTRISGLFVRQRLLQQMQSDQRDLFRAQNQISTGRRIGLPSEDAPAAQRAISLQRLLERKEQVRVNLETNQSFLTASDVALSNVSNLLSQVRGSAVSVADTVSSVEQRDAVAQEVGRAVEQLIDTANQNFRGRYLFAGAKTNVRPLTQLNNSFVRYDGNEGTLRSYSDVDVLFETNVDSQQVFGVISEPVRGSVDLNPILTTETPLSALRGGVGVSPGSITISDGASSSTIDLSSASTIGDVARLIETQPPEGREITATITSTGLLLEIDSAGGGLLRVTEVGGGTTANELGILEEGGTSEGRIAGGDLDPTLQLTTRLDDILGSRAIGRVASPGANNDILIEATTVGAEQFVDDGALQAAAGLSGGNEIAEYDDQPRAARTALTFAGADNDLILTAATPGAALNDVAVRITSNAVGGAPTASFDPVAKELTIDLESDGTSTANQVIAALAAVPEFTAELDTSLESSNTGNGPIAAFADAEFADTAHSGGDAGTLYVRISPTETTAQNVVDAINTQVAEFSAQVDSRDAINPTSAGAGLVELTATGTTFDGSGAPLDRTSGLQITNGGQTRVISLATAETIEELLNIINGSDAGAIATINTTATGIDIRSRLSGANFHIGENGGQTATQLGVRSFRGDTPLAEMNFGRGVQIVEGTDFIITRNDGVELEIDLEGAQTIDDVLERINTAQGNRIEARVALTGDNNDLLLTASAADTELDNVDIVVATQPSPPGAVNGVAVAYDGDASTYTITLDSNNNGISTAAIIAAIEADGTFSAEPDTLFEADNTQANGFVDGATVTTGTLANTGSSGSSVIARLAQFGNGIELVDDDPVPSTNPGVTNGLSVRTVTLSLGAVHLGLVPEGSSESNPASPAVAPRVTADLDNPNSDIVFAARQPGTSLEGVDVRFVNSGSVTGDAAVVTYDPAAGTLTFDIDPTQTRAQTVIDAVTAQVGEDFTATLSTANGPNDGQGLIGPTHVDQSFTLSGGQPEILTGADVRPLEAEGVFNTLLRLQKALGTDDLVELERTLASLDNDITRINFARAENGARQQGLDTLQARLDDEEIELRSSLSNEIDVDLTEAITELTQRQQSFQASLRTAGAILQLTLLDFI